jgi:hypothetical protein
MIRRFGSKAPSQLQKSQVYRNYQLMGDGDARTALNLIET